MRLRLGLLPALLIALALAVARPARAEDNGGLGLDLSDDGKKDGPTSKPVEKPVDAPPLDEPGGAKPVAKSALDVGEHDVSADDRVKSVQHKRFNKRLHFEVAPHAGLTLNDAFYEKLNLGAAAAFHFSDALAVAARADYLFVQTTDNVPTAKRELHSRLPVSKPKYDGALDFMWTPIYGKASLFNTIVHFDTFVLAGAGVVFSQTSSNAANSDPRLNEGPHPCIDLGVGQRYGLNELMAFEWQAVETLYNDIPGGNGPATLQKMLTLNVGLSFFLPPIHTD